MSDKISEIPLDTTARPAYSVSMRDLGRIDYSPRAKQYVAIWYVGKKDTPIGRFDTKEQAAKCLQDKIQSKRRVS